MSTMQEKKRNKHFAKNTKTSDEKVDITREEFNRISDAMKNEEFRKLLVDYCEEIQDPENRKKYEDEIKQLEAERGVDVRFINPEPGFVIKTSVNGEFKCFVNVAKSSEVQKPTSERHFDNHNNKYGINWSLPLAQGAPRDDIDANKKRCKVYDVVFNPDTLRLAERNSEFRKCLIDTALDAVERAHDVKLDRTNLKFPKMNFKGIARPTVIRTLSKNPPPEASEPHPLEDLYPAMPSSTQPELTKLPLKTAVTIQPEFTTPNYIIKHRRGVDFTECTYELDAKLNLTKPRELLIEIELPMLKSTAECQLDVTSKTIYFLSERPGAKYRLNVDLPYTVDDKNGSARFDTELRRLCITLPVIQVDSTKQREMHDTLLHVNCREDSGVESDIREDNSEPRESPIDELNSDSTADDVSSVDIEAEKMNKIEEFLDSTIDYKFPQKFDCNVLDDLMSFVLHVRNVQEQSIVSHKTEKFIHLRFTTIGFGYFPTHYAFYLEIPKESNVQIINATPEAWENNLVLNLTLKSNLENGEINCEEYFAGVNSSQLKKFIVHSKFQLSNSKRNESNLNVNISVEKSKMDEKIVNIEVKPRDTNNKEQNNEEDDEDEDEAEENINKRVNKKQQRKKSKKIRSLSESDCDDLNKLYPQKQDENLQNQNQNENNKNTKQNQEKSDNFAIPKSKQRSYSECRADSGNGGSFPPSFKGILKHCSRYEPRQSISDSYSSIDELSSYGCSVDGSYTKCTQHHNCIPEEDGSTTNLSESCKKTVRFNDNIKKQIFR